MNGNLNLSRAIGDLKYKGNEKLAPAEQIITAQPDIVKVVSKPLYQAVISFPANSHRSCCYTY